MLLLFAGFIGLSPSLACGIQIQDAFSTHTAVQLCAYNKDEFGTPNPELAWRQGIGLFAVSKTTMLPDSLVLPYEANRTARDR